MKSKISINKKEKISITYEESIENSSNFEKLLDGISAVDKRSSKINHLKEQEDNDISNTNNNKNKFKSQNKKENFQTREYRPSKKKFNEKEESESNKIFNPKKQHLKTPKNFYENFELIKEMRNSRPAPVDENGFKWTQDENTDRPTFKFHILVALVLGTLTNDKTISVVMKRLQKFGLSVDRMANISEAELLELIKEVNFHNRKATFLIKIAKELKEKYNSDPPETFQEITSLKGVGPKIGNLYLQCCCNIAEGMGVDVHVHRICNRLKWTNSKSPEETMKQLEEWLPKELYLEMNLVLVGFGQEVCKAKKPKCGDCLISDHCPFFKESGEDLTKSKKVNTIKRKSRSFSVKNLKKKLDQINDSDSGNETEYEKNDDQKSSVETSKIDVKIKNERKGREKSSKLKKRKRNGKSDDDILSQSDRENSEKIKSINDEKNNNKNKKKVNHKSFGKMNMRKSQTNKDLLYRNDKMSIENSKEKDSEDEAKININKNALNREKKSNKTLTRTLSDFDNEKSRASLLKGRRKKK